MTDMQNEEVNENEEVKAEKTVEAEVAVEAEVVEEAAQDNVEELKAEVKSGLIRCTII